MEDKQLPEFPCEIAKVSYMDGILCKLSEKVALSNRHQLYFSEFGTRRRFSFEVHLFRTEAHVGASVFLWAINESVRKMIKEPVLFRTGSFIS